MRTLTTVGGIVLAAVALLVVFGWNAPQAEARPQYIKAFAAKYPDLEAAAKKAKCTVCHPGNDKKKRNAYAQAFGKGLGKKNQKDAEVINKALTDAEEAKNADGKTFGEIIKSGELPEQPE